MTEPTNLASLPLDILVLIFPYLGARSFLSLCSTCKSLHSDELRLDPTYWSHATRSNFRVPNRPVIQSDGQRWYRLYKRLLTQSRVYTWGSNGSGCLGHSFDEGPQVHGQGPPLRFRGRPIRLREGGGNRPARLPEGYILTDKAAWPKEMENTNSIGTVADLQCGGWSTTILSSKGILHTVGVLNGERSLRNNPILSPLHFPLGFPKPGERYEPTTAIRQFSSGRQHVLGTADSGRIWSWWHEKKAGTHIKLLHHETVEDKGGSPQPGHGRVRQVVAGWNKSSALVSGVGIVLWEPVDGVYANNVDVDTMLVAETAVVPSTSYTRPRKNVRDTDEVTHALGQTVGEVTNYILLEAYVVFVTDTHRVFCAKVESDEGTLSIPHCLDLDILDRTSEQDDKPCASDIHGSFRSFAVLKSTGEVLTASQAYLDACWSHVFDATLPGSLRDLPYQAFESARAAASAPADTPAGLRELFRYPALQNTGVNALAFGDYHFHALHSNGSITSFGHEPKGCGALGLGSSSADPHGQGEADMRGVKYLGFMRDGELVPQAYETGRQVWFQREKTTWLQFLANGGHDPEEARERMHLWRQSQDVQGLVSDWVEQKGRGWDQQDVVKTSNDDGLDAHFALSVAAAGHHSGALVLVNEGLAEAVAKSCIIEDPEYGKNAAEEPLGPEPQDEGPPVSSSEDGEAGARTNSTLPFLFDVVLNLGRSFLGLPVVGPATNGAPEREDERPHRDPPINPLASPGVGERYAWAYDSFPRLKLRDGSEMPGNVELS